MMNKPMMGQQPAPSGPPSLNFQSDPGMRSQFKGFMSGMAARNMPAPQPQPAMTMPAMPQQMSSVDIFQPVRNFYAGGGVGYGGGQVDPGLAAAVGMDTGGRGGSAATSRGMSQADYSAMGGEDQRNDPSSIQNILSAPRPAITQLYDQGIAALQNLFRDDAQADQLVAADANMNPAGDALSNLVDRNMQMQQAVDRMRRGEAANALQNQIQSVIDSNAADEIVNADTNLLNADIFAAEDADRLAQRQAAEEITRRGGVVNVDPVTGEVTAQVTGPEPRPTGPQFDNLGAMGEGFPSSVVDIATPIPRPTPPRNMDAASPYDMVPVETPVGYDEVGTQVSVQQAPAPESILDRAARKDEVPEGFIPGLRNLQKRSESEIFNTSEMVPGIGAALAGLANKIGQGVSGKILEKVQSGGTPVYGPGGMIVGVYDQSGPFGSTVYTGRPGYENPELARRISLQAGNESTLPESVSSTIRSFTQPEDDGDPISRFFGKILNK